MGYFAHFQDAAPSYANNWPYKLFLCSVSSALEGVQTVSGKTWCSSSSYTLEKLERKKIKIQEKLHQKRKVSLINRTARDGHESWLHSATSENSLETPIVTLLTGWWVHECLLVFASSNIQIKGRAAEATILRVQLQQMHFFVLNSKKSVSKKKPDAQDLRLSRVHHTFVFHILLNNFLMTAELKKVRLSIHWGAHSQCCVL